MSLLSRLLHVLLCLALVAGGSRVAIGNVHATSPATPVDGGCHAAAVSAPASAAVHHVPDASVVTDTADASVLTSAGAIDDCCDEGACTCACPIAVQVVLAVPGPVLPASGPGEGPAGVAVDARGPPRLALALRPPIG